MLNTVQSLAVPPTVAPAAMPALVDQGVSSLSGWGAALLVIVVLGLVAGWVSRPSHRRQRPSRRRPRP
jgi:hypothetical protein